MLFAGIESVTVQLEPGMPSSKLVEPPVITPSTISRGVQVGTSDTAPVDLASTMENLISVAQSLGLTNILPTLCPAAHFNSSTREKTIQKSISQPVAGISIIQCFLFS